MVEVLGLLEHVLPEHALVQAGGGDRAGVVEAAGADVVREHHDVARALDVGEALRFLVGFQVVHRGQVEEMPDPALQLAPLGGRNAEAGQGEVAVDRDRAGLVHAPVLEQGGDALGGLLAHQEMHHCPLAFEQLANEPPAYEAGRAGDEVVHPRALRCPVLLRVARPRSAAVASARLYSRGRHRPRI